MNWMVVRVTGLEKLLRIWPAEVLAMIEVRYHAAQKSYFSVISIALSCMHAFNCSVRGAQGLQSTWVRQAPSTRPQSHVHSGSYFRPSS
jgi:hypothetical protein